MQTVNYNSIKPQRVVPLGFFAVNVYKAKLINSEEIVLNESQQKNIEQWMRGGDFEQALNYLDQLKLDDSSDRDILYFRAVCLRYLGKLDAALEQLAELKKDSAGFARAFQEEGHCYKAKGDGQAALKAYSLATQANPALVASWQALRQLGQQFNQAVVVNQAEAQLQYLGQQPKAIVSIIDLVAEGKWVKAENLCRKFLQKNPRYVEAMRLLADIGIRLGVLDDAEFLLESAHVFEPNNKQVQMDYIQVLRKRQKFQEALSQAQALWQSNPSHPQFSSVYAIECMHTGDYEQAIELFEQVLERLPNEPITLTSRGHALKTWGKTPMAIESYRTAIDAKPNHGEAWYSLANLKTVKFEQTDIDQMLAQLNSGNLSAMDSVYLHFALGKAFEDIGEFKHSFYHYQEGNTRKKQQSRYRAELMTEEFIAQEKTVTPELVAKLKGAGCDAPDPIFILGLPRAGSTLLEQILASHSQVDGTLELPNVLSLVHKLRRGERFSGENHYPSILAELPGEKYREFGEQYLRDTAIHRQGAPSFIDKMPNNFRHIGLIKLMLPNAKIIDARREPMACCFSGFKQLFAEGQEFSYSLEDIGLYYRDYLKLMNYWQQLFPGEILHVQYETVVDDFENQVRRILDYCNLPFEQACLDFYKNERAVRTASSEQVRQPIYKSGVDQWQNYEPFLEPLKEALNRP